LTENRGNFAGKQAIMPFTFDFPYSINPDYKTPVAYFCMEYAIHQPLKVYAGGLGFLAGSHMRSAYTLEQNMVGIGILWKYGYYDQGRKSDQAMEVVFREKTYRMLVDTGIKFTIRISGHPVWVTAFYLPPSVFKTAPVFFLTTEVAENDFLAKTISHKLYDSNPETQAAAGILLGEGGARLLEAIGYHPAVYHLNESHALPLAFYLYGKYHSLVEVKKRLVFTNHTPEPAGNQHSDLYMDKRMGFLGEISIEQVKQIAQTSRDSLDHTLTALHFSGKSNAVSAIHLQTMKDRWVGYGASAGLLSITNAQNFDYWADREMYEALEKKDDVALMNRKKEAKLELFEEVADQCGVVFDPEVLTIIFAKRFAGYKRPELLFHDMEFFHRLLINKDRPIQMIWAGKPYPMDFAGIASFDRIVNVCRTYPNCAILSGYELKLSRLLKGGADVWLNTPRLGHEASGTSGMSAAMNGCVNVSIPDGWYPEFVRDGMNGFVIPNTEVTEHKFQQDETDAHNTYALLEKAVIPLYYDQPAQWLSVIRNSMRDISPAFDSNRMAREYYEHLYMGMKE
jgi:starch phosphorylase